MKASQLGELHYCAPHWNGGRLTRRRILNLIPSNQVVEQVYERLKKLQIKILYYIQLCINCIKRKATNFYKLIQNYRENLIFFKAKFHIKYGYVEENKVTGWLVPL